MADFNQLPPEDEATLRTHLTEEQREWLDRVGGRGRDDSERGQQMEEELKMVVSVWGEERRGGGKVFIFPPLLSLCRPVNWTGSWGGYRATVALSWRDVLHRQ